MTIKSSRFFGERFARSPAAAWKKVVQEYAGANDIEITEV